MEYFYRECRIRRLYVLKTGSQRKELRFSYKAWHQTANIFNTAGILKEGYNKIVMQLFNGKSLTFDAICLNGPQETQINKIGDTPIISMKMADYELEQGKTRTQPLLLKTITKNPEHLKYKSTKRRYSNK